MTSIVAALDENDTVGSAASYFLRFRINSAPVVDQQGLLVGILGEKDVMSIMLGAWWWTKRIKDIMKRNVVSYEETASALTIYEFLCRVTIRGVVVVSQGRPTGLITRGSLLRYFMNELAVSRAVQPDCQSEALGAAFLSKFCDSQPQQRIADTVRVLGHEVTNLAERLDENADDIVPCVVGGASRIQELVNDLLSISSYAHHHAGVEPSEA
jgi:CBS-domain-containing membrane protein